MYKLPDPLGIAFFNIVAIEAHLQLFDMIITYQLDYLNSSICNNCTATLEVLFTCVSHHRKKKFVTMCGDGCYCSDHFTRYTYTESCSTLKTYIILYVNYISNFKNTIQLTRDFQVQSFT